ncbi:hypothetical protein ACO1O0_005260 [Amphichorda felina]
MSKSAAIATYRRFPKELFRVNSGWRVKLRPFKTNNPEAFYDIATAHEEGKRLREMKVLPKALELDYKSPNGATLRPNTPYLQHYVARTFRGQNVIVYGVQEGTEVPEDLILVHEGPDREEWSLQPAREMTLDELNESITKFLLDSGSRMTREQWCKAYPKPTEPHGPNYPLPKNWRARVNPPKS